MHSPFRIQQTLFLNGTASQWKSLYDTGAWVMCPPNIRMVCPYLKLHHFWYCSIATQCLRTISNCLLQEWKFFFLKYFWNPMEHFIIANHVVEHADVTFGVKVPDIFYKNWWRFWRWELQYFRLFLPLFNSHYNEKTLYFLLCSFLISWGMFSFNFSDEVFLEYRMSFPASNELFFRNKELSIIQIIWPNCVLVTSVHAL